jgi:hypothetical protein
MTAHGLPCCHVRREVIAPDSGPLPYAGKQGTGCFPANRHKASRQLTSKLP